MILSKQNEKIKLIRRLKSCKESELALLEGPHLIRAAVEAGIELHFLLVDPKFEDSVDGVQLLGDLDVGIHTTDPRLLEQLSDVDSPRGVVAVCRWSDPVVAAVPVVANGAYLYLDGIQDPGNLGALARVAEAFGATALALGQGSCHPNHPRALRASAGSLLRLPIAAQVDAPRLQEHLKEISPLWVGLCPRGGVFLNEGAAQTPFVLAIGAEGPGLSAQVAELLDIALTIRMTDRVESLNAQVAAAIALYELIGRPTE